MKVSDIHWGTARDMLSIGMRLAYMHDLGLIEIDTTLPGENSMADFALELLEKYNPDDDIGWDEYIETAIRLKYGIHNKEELNHEN